MSSLADYTSSLKTSVSDKITHPLLGSFIVSWFFFNWEGVYFLSFSNLDTAYKLKAVSENYSNICINLIYPLIISFFVAFLLPWATAIFIRSASRAKEFEINSLALFYRKHRLSLNESNALRDFYKNEKTELELRLSESNENQRKLELRFEEQFKKKKEKFESLYKLIAFSNVPPTLIDKHLTNQEKEYLEILEMLLAGGKEVISFSTLSSALKSKFTYNLEENLNSLHELEYLTFVDSGQQLKEVENFSITSEGIEFICNTKSMALAESI
ncbi:hypothetical protein CWC28_21110 [Pseudoalteromonas sp. S4492]|uniref:hypothetical protein n=1 Tax=Pseudoalteromonas sp. S4492 TaxID=579560 RepID=UPI00110A7FEE|nr:hypothetical protein [Pseudoalteromonas sp. S4492]TMO22090.1 hypothetical protein CWC28_21110 [Pseudoalteromonas sp. S4492]